MAKIKKCRFCNGTGKIYKTDLSQIQEVCKKCNGKGVK